jgi:hypothetical protein
MNVQMQEPSESVERAVIRVALSDRVLLYAHTPLLQYDAAVDVL